VTILLAFLFMLLVVAAMSIGVIFGREPIRGSCGGLAQLGLGECEICGGDPARCETTFGSVDTDELGYDATEADRRE
jgi:uncharacterized protein